MLSDRRAAHEGFGLPIADALALESELGAESIATGLEGATRFAGGAGRHGEGAGA
jgi:enoyl-CoA hydratase